MCTQFVLFGHSESYAQIVVLKGVLYIEKCRSGLSEILELFQQQALGCAIILAMFYSISRIELRFQVIIQFL